MRTFDEALAALSALGELKPGPGGWSPGQVLAHCAQSIELSLTGFPRQRSWVVRNVFGPLVKRRFLKAGRMTHDLVGPIPGADELDPATTQDEGRERLVRAIASFRAHQGPLQPHFAYGAVSREEYEALHTMHLADHLSSMQ